MGALRGADNQASKGSKAGGKARLSNKKRNVKICK